MMFIYINVSFLLLWQHGLPTSRDKIIYANVYTSHLFLYVIFVLKFSARIELDKLLYN